MRRVAEMHQISHSILQRALAGNRVSKAASGADQQLLAPAEEIALKVWCLDMAKWGFPVRLDLLRQMAAAVLIDRKRRNILDASDAFDTIMDTESISFVEVGADPKTGLIDVTCVGPQWYRRFLLRHPDLKAVQSRSLDYDRAKANDPATILEYFKLVKDTIQKYKIKTRFIFNMNEKGFLIGLIRKSMKVIISSSEKNAFLRQPGNRQTVTVVEAIGTGGQDIPPMVILKGEHHLFGWYKKALPPGWVTAISPNGWTDSYLALEWLKRNFEPYTRPEKSDDWRLLILDGHESHITWEFIAYAMSHKIICLCLPPHSSHVTQPLDVGIFSPYEGAYSKALAEAQREGITGIDKILFLEIFQTARAAAFTQRNIRGAFRGAGLFPLNPSNVLAKLPKSPNSMNSVATISSPASPETSSSRSDSCSLNSSAPEVNTGSLECPRTPRSSERVKRHLQDIMDDLDDVEVDFGTSDQGYSLSPIRKKVRQLASSAVTAMAGLAIQTQNNTQLRATIKKKKTSTKHLMAGQPGDRTQLTKARVLDSAEAQRLKEHAEARAAQEALVKMRVDQRKQEKVHYKPIFHLAISNLVRVIVIE